MTDARRDPASLALRAIAVLIALRAVTNLFKPLGSGTGLVFFGTLLTGTPMLVAATLLGLYMLIWAYGLWQGSRFAIPMGVAYTAYVVVNIFRFPVVNSLGKIPLAAYAVYGLVAIGIPAAAVWLVATRGAAAD